MRTFTCLWMTQCWKIQVVGSDLWAFIKANQVIAFNITDGLYFLKCFHCSAIRWLRNLVGYYDPDFSLPYTSYSENSQHRGGVGPVLKHLMLLLCKHQQCKASQPYPLSYVTFPHQCYILRSFIQHYFMFSLCTLHAFTPQRDKGIHSDPTEH